MNIRGLFFVFSLCFLFSPSLAVASSSLRAYKFALKTGHNYPECLVSIEEIDCDDYEQFASDGDEEFAKKVHTDMAEIAASIIQAVREGNCSEVNRLAFEAEFNIRHLRDPDAFDGKGASILALAALNGDEKMIRTLGAWGCDVFERGLRKLARNSEHTLDALSALRCLRDKELKRKSPEHILDLLVALMNGNVEDVKKIASDYSVDLTRIRFKDTHFFSPLHIAALFGRLGLIEFLLEEGCDIDSKYNTLKISPINLALDKDEIDAAAYLLQVKRNRKKRQLLL